MSLEEQCRTAAHKTCGVKTMMCRMQGGPCDLAGMVHFTLRGVDGLRVLLLGEGHVSETIPKAWAQIVQQGIPEFVLVLGESYVDPTLDPQAYREAGQLAGDFKDNACSQVRENICVYGIDAATGRQLAIRIPFTYDDQGMPTFEEPIVFDTTGEGLRFGSIPIPYILAGCNKGLGG
jgi:hypothetical protein